MSNNNLTPWEFQDTPEEVQRTVDADREKFETSPVRQQIIEAEHTEARQDQMKEYIGDPSFLKFMGEGTVEFAQGTVEGAAAGGSEILETFGLLEDGAYSPPDAESLSQNIGRSVGQFLPYFIPATGAARAGLGALKVFQKGGALAKWLPAISGAVGGAMVDFTAYDPEDPNIANAALGFSALENFPTLKHMLSEYLATDSEDSDLKNRTKNVMVGLIAGGMAESLLKAGGWTKGRLAEKIGQEGLEAVSRAAGEEAQQFVSHVENSVASNPNLKEALTENTPNVEQAVAIEAHNAKQQQNYESVATPGLVEKLKQVIGESGESPIMTKEQLEEFLTINAGTLLTSDQTKTLITHMGKEIGETLTGKGLGKEKLTMPDLGALSELFDIPLDNLVARMQEARGNARDMLGQILVSRQLVKVNAEQLLRKSEQLKNLIETKAPADKLDLVQKEYDNLVENSIVLHAEAGYHSKTASQMLSAFKRDKMEKLSAPELQRRFIQVINEPSAKWKAKLPHNISSIEKTIRNEKILRSSASLEGVGSRKVALDPAEKKAIVDKVDRELPVSRNRKKTPEQIKKQKQERQQKIKEELEKAIVKKAKLQMTSELSKLDVQSLRTRANFLYKSKLAKTVDVLNEVYVNGLLSSFKTPIINFAGNGSVIISSIVERLYASALPGSGIEAKEALLLMSKGLGAWKEALEAGSAAFRGVTDVVDYKTDFYRPYHRAISREAWDIQNPMVGGIVDMFGKIVNLPGKLALSADEVFKVLNYRGEASALAYRKAVQEANKLGLEGRELTAEVSKRHSDIMGDILSDAHDDITTKAHEYAKVNTFTNPFRKKLIPDPTQPGKFKEVPGLSENIKNTLDSHSLLRIFLPFFQTPVNILDYGLQRTSLVNNRYWQASKQLKDELMSDDPSVAALAKAKTDTGLAIMGTATTLALTGNITGYPPKDYRLREAMEQQMGGPHWNSIRIGDKWYKYDRLDPFGFVFQQAANLATLAKHMFDLSGAAESNKFEIGEYNEKYKEILYSGLTSIATSVVDRHYLQGISDLVHLMDGDPRYMVSNAKRVMGYFDPSLSFYSSFRRNLSRVQDQGGILAKKLPKPDPEGLTQELIGDAQAIWQHAHQGEEIIRGIIPGYGTRSFSKNLVGEMVVRGDGWDSMINPIIHGHAQSKSPLIKKIAELEMPVAQPWSVKNIQGVDITNEEQDYFMEEYGKLNKAWEKETEASYFKKFPEGIQRNFIESKLDQTEKVAKKLTIAKFPRLAEAIGKKKIGAFEQKLQQKVPTGFQQLNP